MRSFICALALMLGGCIGPQHRWEPDSVYTETSSYDFPHSIYQEVGVSGEISGTGGARFDVFGATSLDTHGNRDHAWGGGFRFEIPLK